MTGPIQVGLIGGGMWGRVHLDGLRELGGDRTQIRWVCTRTPENLAARRDEYDVPHTTTDYREMLADPDLDAVIVSTPPFLHAEHGVAVLEAGKHLLLEKPMATTATDADRLVAAAAARPELVGLEASCRFTMLNPKFDFVRSIIDSGRLGRVYQIHFHEMKPTTFVEYNPRAADWAEDPERAGGGPVIDWGPYDLAFHLGLLGAPRAVRDISATAMIRDGIERHAAAIVELDGGVAYHFERAGGAPHEERSTTRIHGTRGTLVLGYQPWEPQEMELLTRAADGTLERETLTCSYERKWHENTYLLEHFVECIAGTARPVMPLDRARANLAVLLGVLARIRGKQNQ